MLKLKLSGRTHAIYMLTFPPFALLSGKFADCTEYLFTQTLVCGDGGGSAAK